MASVYTLHSDPKDCLNMLFKHMLQVPAFVLIRYVSVQVYLHAATYNKFNFIYRQQYSVESDFFVQLSVDPNLTMPSMGKLLKRMFKEELQVSFTKVTMYYIIIIGQLYRCQVSGTLSSIYRRQIFGYLLFTDSDMPTYHWLT